MKTILPGSILRKDKCTDRIPIFRLIGKTSSNRQRCKQLFQLRITLTRSDAQQWTSRFEVFDHFAGEISLQLFRRNRKQYIDTCAFLYVLGSASGYYSPVVERSEERRVGKEGRCGRSASDETQ